MHTSQPKQAITNRGSSCSANKTFFPIDQWMGTASRVAYAAAGGMTRDEELAKDIAQDVMLRIWEAHLVQTLPAFTSHRGFFAFVRQAVRWRIMSHFRSKKVRCTLPTNLEGFEGFEDWRAASPVERAETRESVAQTRLAWQQLAPEDAILLKLRYIDGESYGSMRQVLGRNHCTRTIANHTRQAMDRYLLLFLAARSSAPRPRI